MANGISSAQVKGGKSSKTGKPPKSKFAKTKFKEGRFKEFEHYDANGQEDGEEKVESEKSGWMRDDEDEIDI